MKRRLLFSCIILAAVSVNAQPVIQYADFNYLATPMFWLKYNAAQSAVNPGVAGANVTWDFSALEVPSSLIYTTGTCPGDADCGTFPGASQVLDGNGSKVYLNTTGLEMTQIGEKTSSAVVFSDPMKLMQFPVTFNQTFTDAFAATSPIANKSGTVTSTIDAYGTLKTPTGTYVNVLRQKITENSVVTSPGQTYSLTVSRYFWMKPGIHHHIMEIVITQITGLPNPVPLAYAITFTTHQDVDPPGPVGIADVQTLQEQIRIIPNPVTDMLNIQSPGTTVQQVSLYNVMGQKLWDRPVENKADICSVDLRPLKTAAGCYFLKIKTTGGTITKKVVIH